MLNHIITETIREDLAGQRWYCDARAFPLQDVTEVFEVGVAASDSAVLELEGGDVRAANYLVIGVHAA